VGNGKGATGTKASPDDPMDHQGARIEEDRKKYEPDSPQIWQWERHIEL
jgi:hypothetical protein